MRGCREGRDLQGPFRAKILCFPASLTPYLSLAGPHLPRTSVSPAPLSLHQEKAAHKQQGLPQLQAPSLALALLQGSVVAGVPGAQQPALLL